VATVVAKLTLMLHLEILFVEFCGAFQRLRTVTAGEALISMNAHLSFLILLQASKPLYHSSSDSA
jgi:hypothetical protein